MALSPPSLSSCSTHHDFADDKATIKRTMHSVHEVLTKVPGVDPRVNQRMQFFSGLNEGPANTAARIAGLVQKQDAKDDSPIYTGNFGQPIPDPGYVLCRDKSDKADYMLVIRSMSEVSRIRETLSSSRSNRPSCA